MIARREDWDIRLADLLRDRAARAFQWGEHDCCLFVCDAIQAVTGVDPAAPLRGRYADACGARRAIRDAGYRSLAMLVEDVSSRYGFAEHGNVRCARRGDMAWYRDLAGWTLGVISLNGVEIVSAGKQGLQRAPLSAAARVWRIG